jgi:branched-chain amino acid transport system ATP-binding protein
MLEVTNLSVSYDTALILNDVSMEIRAEELVGLVGPNGAGKTTLLRAITGLVRWERDNRRGQREGRIRMEGSVRFGGLEISNLPAHQIVRLGLIHCPERRRPFTEMTVYENLLAGAYLLKKSSPEFRRLLDEVYTLFPVLKERARQLAGTLSGGEQQMLAIGRSLMQKPRLLCIDEPSIGLAPKIKADLFEKIAAISRMGITILLVEQDVALTFAMAGRSYILSHGSLVTGGACSELLQDETIRKSYLGL